MGHHISPPPMVDISALGPNMVIIAVVVLCVVLIVQGLRPKR